MTLDGRRLFFQFRNFFLELLDESSGIDKFDVFFQIFLVTLLVFYSLQYTFQLGSESIQLRILLLRFLGKFGLLSFDVRKLIFGGRRLVFFDMLPNIFQFLQSARERCLCRPEALFVLAS